jgi:hypothetical protein
MSRQVVPGRRSSLSVGVWAVLLAITLAWRSLGVDASPETVKVTVPGSVSFGVSNVNVSTVGSPNPTSMSFNSLSVTAAHVLRVSVKADSDFVPPSGTAIPASRVSWTTSSPTNGVGTNGVLSTTAYGQLFQSTLTKKNGSINIVWTLAAPGTPLRAGNHSLTMRWKFESILP